MRAVFQSRGALNALAALLPDTAERIRGAITENVPLSELCVGDIGQAGSWVGREGGADGGGSGAEEVFARVYEPTGRSGGVSPIEVRRT